MGILSRLLGWLNSVRGANVHDQEKSSQAANDDSKAVRNMTDSSTDSFEQSGSIHKTKETAESGNEKGESSPPEITTESNSKNEVSGESQKATDGSEEKEELESGSTELVAEDKSKLNQGSSDQSMVGEDPDSVESDENRTSEEKAESTDRGQEQNSTTDLIAESSKEAEETITAGQSTINSLEFAELTAFQRDLLIIISGMEKSKGLEIKEEAEKYYDDEIHHGRLYPNLDTLVEEELVEKVSLDGRSNGYRVTEKGEAHVVARGKWESKQLGNKRQSSRDDIGQASKDNSISEPMGFAGLDSGASESKIAEKIRRQSAVETQEVSEKSNDRRDALIRELQDFKTSLGRMPTVNDIGRFSDFTVENIANEFGSFESALETAEINVQKYLIDDLQRVSDELGTNPTHQEYDKQGKYDSDRYLSYFGSWSQALIHLSSFGGFDSESKPKKDMNKGEELPSEADSVETESNAAKRERLIDRLKQLENSLGRLPKAQEINEHTEFTQYDYVSEFKSLDEAFAAAGIDKKERLLDDFRKVADELGGVPTTTEYDRDGVYTAGMLQQYFGSWSAVKKDFCIKYDIVEVADEIDCYKDVLLRELLRLEKELDRRPNKQDINEQTPFHVQEYTSEFGSFNSALENSDIGISNASNKIKLESASEENRDEERPSEQVIDSSTAHKGTLSKQEQERLLDIIQLAPTDSWELQDKWGVDDRSEVVEYLRSVLIDYYYRDNDRCIRPTEEAKSLVEDTTDRKAMADAEDKRVDEVGDETSVDQQKQISNSVEYYDDELQEKLDYLQRLYSELGRVPFPYDLDSRGEYDSDVYYEEFGSWDEALQGAGVDKQEALCDEIRRVADKIESEPTRMDLVGGQYSVSAYENAFGSVEAAIEAALTESDKDDAMPEGARDSNENEEKANAAVSSSNSR